MTLILKDGYADFPNSLATTLGNRMLVSQDWTPVDGSITVRLDFESPGDDDLIHNVGFYNSGVAMVLAYLPYGPVADNSFYTYMWDTVLGNWRNVASTQTMRAAVGMPASERWQFRWDWNAADRKLYQHHKRPVEDLNNEYGWTQIVASAAFPTAQLGNGPRVWSLGPLATLYGGHRIYRCIIKELGAPEPLIDWDFRDFKQDPGSSFYLPTGQLCTVSDSNLDTDPLILGSGGYKLTDPNLLAGDAGGYKEN